LIQCTYEDERSEGAIRDRLLRDRCRNLWIRKRERDRRWSLGRRERRRIGSCG